MTTADKETTEKKAGDAPKATLLERHGPLVLVGAAVISAAIGVVMLLIIAVII